MTKKIIDLFCGCGGFTEGFLFSENGIGTGWEALLGIDNNPIAVETFQTNFGEEFGKVDDLLDCDPHAYLDGLNLDPGELDHLHASPPCEDYSENNKVNGNGRDGRFRIVLDWVEVFQPKVLTIENVHNLAKAHDAEIQQRLTTMGYRVIPFKIDAADYGVPQNRIRLFYLACREEFEVNLHPPIPTHCDPNNSQVGLKHWVTVKQAIGDLPQREVGDGPDQFISKIDKNNPSNQLSEYALKMRPQRGTAIMGHEARLLNELAMERLQHLEPGQAIEDLPENLQPRMGFRGAYGRMHPNRPAKTITTGIRGPSHGPFCHYNQDRLITIREAARLQSFPDAFIFTGRRYAQCLMIGNAVPPLLSRAIKNLSEAILLHA